MAIDIVKWKLSETDVWKSPTNLTRDQIVNMSDLQYILKNSYFTFDGARYHQVSGCATGSSVSAVIAVQLIVQEKEKNALQTSSVQPRWWRQYVDDAKECRKKSDIQCFHHHLNSINQQIHAIYNRNAISFR